MNAGTASFEPCIRAPSPAPSSFTLPSFGVSGPHAHMQSSQYPPPSSIESIDGSIYSKPYSIESSSSMASWSSAEVNWARRGVVAEEVYRSLRSENAALAKQVSTWQTKFETLQSAYNLLLERVPAPPEAERKRLLPDDHKAIDYWYRHQWTSASASNRITEISSKAENENGDEDVEAEGEELESVSPAPGSQRGQGRCRAGINVSMRYIQDTDGKVIDGHRAREIRIHARAIFVGFAMQGKHFASWGDADATSRRFFYNEMVIRFEELQYCDLDWKAEQIATDTFPGWKTTWVKKQKKASLEPPNGMKRSRQGSIVENTDLKRTKSMEIDEATSSVPVPQVSATSLDTSQPVPVLNVIPNTPIRPGPLPAMPQLSSDAALLQPNKPHYDFMIGNPLPLPAAPGGAFNLEHQQQFVMNNMQGAAQNYMPIDPSVPIAPAPAKRSRTGTTRMRPSKTSITPRNLCAFEWAVSHPKGTTDEFSTYYDSLSSEGKEKWEKLSAEAKESGKTPSECVSGLPVPS